MNYFVPNFGLDHEVLGYKENLKVAETQLNHKLQIETDPPKGPPKDYFVPNFGMDHEIATSILNEKEASSNMGHKWVVPDKDSVPAAPPKNYFVPNFGLDQDILGAKENLKVAEAQLGHKLNIETDPPKGPPKNYFVPNFGMDEDIAASLKHLNQQESIHGRWELPESMVQLDSNVQADREPLMAKVGVPKSKVGGHPTNYFVPDFGMDEDIITTQSNIKAQKIKFPGASFVQTDSEINREPLLSYSPTIADPPFKMNYFVPNFGLDHEVLGEKENLKLTEEKLGHRLSIETDPPKGPPKDYFVPNFGMDHDIASSLSNLKEAEATGGKM